MKMKEQTSPDSRRDRSSSCFVPCMEQSTVVDMPTLYTQLSLCQRYYLRAKFKFRRSKFSVRFRSDWRTHERRDLASGYSEQTPGHISGGAVPGPPGSWSCVNDLLIMASINMLNQALEADLSPISELFSWRWTWTWGSKFVLQSLDSGVSIRRYHAAGSVCKFGQTRSVLRPSRSYF